MLRDIIPNIKNNKFVPKDDSDFNIGYSLYTSFKGSNFNVKYSITLLIFCKFILYLSRSSHNSLSLIESFHHYIFPIYLCYSI